MSFAYHSQNMPRPLEAIWRLKYMYYLQHTDTNTLKDLLLAIPVNTAWSSKTLQNFKLRRNEGNCGETSLVVLPMGWWYVDGVLRVIYGMGSVLTLEHTKNATSVVSGTLFEEYHACSTRFWLFRMFGARTCHELWLTIYPGISPGCRGS